MSILRKTASSSETSNDAAVNADRQHWHAAVCALIAIMACAAGLVGAGAPIPADSAYRTQALAAARGIPATDHGINRAGYAGDVAPVGVDVTAQVPSAVLAARAQALSKAASTGSGTTAGFGPRRSGGCTGDGTSGPRVEVLYVVPRGRADRYAQVVRSLRTYVARVDNVFLSSARQTKGYRQVRWLHDRSCRPVIRKVLAPATVDNSFFSTQRDLSALGFNRVDRKYLIFMDASKLCGIGSVYLDDRADPSNFNNGRAPQYARVDSPCWGQRFHSVEAHELTHTLGAVLSFAPNGSAAGHCVDESDLMCYEDAADVTMRRVCAAGHEQLLDCNSDDYYSTAPRRGSALDRHWNTATSAFLHEPPRPRLAADRVGFVPGIPVRASVRPSVPSGQGWRIEWTPPAGCSVDRSRTLSSERDATGVRVLCRATYAARIVTARLTQQDGRSVIVAIPLRAAATPRVPRVSVASVRSRGKVRVTVRVLDPGTGRPVHGLPVVVRATARGTTRTLSAGRTAQTGRQMWTGALRAGTRLTVTSTRTPAWTAARAAGTAR